MKKIFLRLFCLFAIIIIMIYYILPNEIKMEGYQTISEYSKTVDLPITFPFSCKNFCGPNNICAITGEQCSDDYDCKGCENINKLKPPPVNPYYNELSPSNKQMDYVYAGSKNNLAPSYLSGQSEWIKIFNEGIKLYNRKELYNNPLSDFEKKNIPVYPITVSMTGQYYETTAPGYNASI